MPQPIYNMFCVSWFYVNRYTVCRSTNGLGHRWRFCIKRERMMEREVSIAVSRRVFWLIRSAWTSLLSMLLRCTSLQQTPSYANMHVYVAGLRMWSNIYLEKQAWNPHLYVHIWPIEYTETHLASVLCLITTPAPRIIHLCVASLSEHLLSISANPQIYINLENGGSPFPKCLRNSRTKSGCPPSGLTEKFTGRTR